METVLNSSQNVKSSNQKRKFNRPNVGVVDVPNITTKGTGDSIHLKALEHKKNKYKLTPKSQKGFVSDNLISASVFALGFLTLLKGLVKHFKK